MAWPCPPTSANVLTTCPVRPLITRYRTTGAAVAPPPDTSAATCIGGGVWTARAICTARDGTCGVVGNGGAPVTSVAGGTGTSDGTGAPGTGASFRMLRTIVCATSARVRPAADCATSRPIWRPAVRPYSADDNPAPIAAPPTTSPVRAPNPAPTAVPATTGTAADAPSANRCGSVLISPWASARRSGSLRSSRLASFVATAPS